MSQPLRPNFGCGTLIVLAIALFAGSRLIPHGQESKRNDPVPKNQIGLKPKPETAQTKALSDPSPTDSHEAEAIIRDSMSLLATWMEQKKEVPSGEPPHQKPQGAPPTDPKPVSKSLVTETAMAQKSPSSEKDASKEEGAHSTTGWLDTLKTASQKVESVMQPPETPKNQATAAPLAGEMVFNNPWDQSVDQVSRYLKKHTHDASSLNILEWGKVTKTAHGYEVRCTFRSKNVLGREITQTRTFALNQAGEIQDIRD